MKHLSLFILASSVFFLSGCGCGRGNFGGRAQGQLTACKSNLKNIGVALEMYCTDWEGHYPPQSTGLNLLTPNYLKTVPTCPAAKAPSYQVEYSHRARTNFRKYDDFYYVHCAGPYHQALKVERNFPAIDGQNGLLEHPRDIERARKRWEREQAAPPSPSPSTTPNVNNVNG